MITCMSASPISVLQAHEVVELRRGRLQDIAIHYRLDLVNELRRDVNGFPGLEAPGEKRVPRLSPKDELALENVHRFILTVVILKTEHMSGLHVKDFSDVPIG